MTNDFTTKLKAAQSAKYYPGTAELAYTILSQGGSLSQVYSELLITPANHSHWLQTQPDYATAIELGLHASKSWAESTGRENLNSMVFQSRTWERLYEASAQALVSDAQVAEDHAFTVNFILAPATQTHDEDDARG